MFVALKLKSKWFIWTLFGRFFGWCYDRRLMVLILVAGLAGLGLSTEAIAEGTTDSSMVLFGQTPLRPCLSGAALEKALKSENQAVSSPYLRQLLNAIESSQVPAESSLRPTAAAERSDSVTQCLD